MIDFVKNKEEFEKHKLKYKSIFNNMNGIDKNPFNSDFNLFVAFEFDFLFCEDFFTGIKIFLNKIKNDRLIFYTINPSPEKYFYKYFKKYNVLEIDLNRSEKELNDILMKNPGDSPADAIAINSNDILWFSQSKDWAIIGSRELETSIVGFTSINAQKLFLSSFEEKNSVFFSIEEHIKNLNKIFKFSKNQNNSFKTMLKKY